MSKILYKNKCFNFSFLCLYTCRTQTLRHLFYLQLRKDFLTDDFCPDPKFALTLGGLALQAEFGDYDGTVYGKEYFLMDHYLPFQCIKQINRSEIKTKLQSQHASLRGISKELAELKFIQVRILSTVAKC